MELRSGPGPGGLGLGLGLGITPWGAYLRYYLDTPRPSLTSTFSGGFFSMKDWSSEAALFAGEDRDEAEACSVPFSRELLPIPGMLWTVPGLFSSELRLFCMEALRKALELIEFWIDVSRLIGADGVLGSPEGGSILVLFGVDGGITAELPPGFDGVTGGG